MIATLRKSPKLQAANLLGETLLFPSYFNFAARSLVKGAILMDKKPR
ncbi:hypothetical protein PALB_23340 [Pseudoalteromonas luteoviolacea B = ATCC 29581]|nr:hypothetical protein PALB_23340 [Pseudoalteromonas luteoviolacea B = ATCC 29581]